MGRKKKQGTVQATEVPPDKKEKEEPKENAILEVIQPPVCFLREEGKKIKILGLDGAKRAFLLAGNGIFEYFETAFGTIIRELPKKRFPNIKESCKLTIEKLPEEFLHRAHHWFREVYDKHKSEANIMYFYNPETKEYREYVPKQEVTGTSVDYKIPDEVYAKYHEDGFIEAGTIHSHPSFGASQSQTDTNDEVVFDGWHITIGHVDRDIPDYHARWMFRGTAFDAEIDDIVQFKTAEKVEFPKDWIEQVAKPAVVVHGYGRVNRGSVHPDIQDYYGNMYALGGGDERLVSHAHKTPAGTENDLGNDHWNNMSSWIETEETAFIFHGEDMVEEVECTVISG